MLTDGGKYLRLALAALCTAGLGACASLGNPSGGPRDEDAPRVLRTYPEQDATGFQGREAQVLFDELVNVKDAFTAVTVSPPEATVPKVISSGRRVIVTWDDTLRSNTTYTVDFGSSIEDVNEGNKLGAYSLTFSTGADIDTMRLSGIVLEASTLEPQKGVLVGVHAADAPDSALRTLRFERATKTDDRGQFTLRGLRPVPYIIYALADLNNDYRWDNPAELMGFYPVPVTPYAEYESVTDTIYNPHTGAVDTVMERTRTLFLPNDLFLPLYDSGYKAQYLVKSERPDSARLSFIFNAKADTLPSLRLLDFEERDEWYVPEHSEHNDSLTFWLTDRRLMGADTLRVALTYMRTASGKQSLEQATDTLVMKRPKVKAPKAKRTKKEMRLDSITAEKARWLSLTSLPGGNLDVYAPLIIEAPEPLLQIDDAALHLEQKQDTLWKRVDAPPLREDTTGRARRYYLDFPWEYGAAYRLSVDSLGAMGTTGRYNGTYKRDIQVKKREDYATLTLRLAPDTVQGYVEVLTTSETPVAKQRLKEGAVTFPYLGRNDYYVRFTAVPDSLPMEFVPGDYDAGRQPSEVYYYPKMLSLKRMDRSEAWDLHATPVDLQKPEAIKKNKPDSSRRLRKKKEKEPGAEGEEDDYFDVSRNPFDPNQRTRPRTAGSY